ncbi:MAG: pilus assembly protein [Planctomycetales bacterium]|nr:pilus assembly protein [Planctomycetales bacterium]
MNRLRPLQRPRNSRQRNGAAMVEFALCLPVFFLIAMGTIETCRMIYLRQSIKIAAYECARLGIMPEVTPPDIQDQCDVILLGRNIANYQILNQPSDPATLQYGELFTVTVEAPAGQNALVGSWLYGDKTLSESVSIMMEY